jgi:hypothetical protein
VAVLAALAGCSREPVVVGPGAAASAVSVSPRAAASVTAPPPPTDAGSADANEDDRSIFSEAEVRAALGKVDEGSHVILADWRARPCSAVALTFRAVSPKSAPAELSAHLFLVEKARGKSTLVATSPINLDDASCMRDPGWEPEHPPSFKLDLADYRITAGETAIGTRFTCDFQAPGAEGTVTRLYLFRQEAGTLSKILAENVELSQYDRVANEYVDSHGILIMQRTQTSGVFDILLRMTDVFRSESGKTRKKTREQRYQWKGSQYGRL